MPSDLREQLQASLGDSYRIERELGGGGMSRVFVADETRLRRRVVVKVLSPELAAGVSAERFERELQLAASLQQANIVPVLSAGETNGLPYYTMPFVEGESLRARIGREGLLPIAEVLSVLRDVTRALAYAHARGVVHRDIKPDNILLSGGTAVVTDFGIAKALAAAGQSTSDGATLTQLGTSIGTPAYMAPEQAAGDPDVDHRADIYAFGCMAYELLTGSAPFANRTPQRMLAAHMTEEPRAVDDLRGDTPRALADLVMRCLAKDPSSRPQTAAAVAQELDAVATSGSLDALPHLARAGFFGRALLIYAGVSIGVLIVAKAAEIAIGLPDWVFRAAILGVMAGLLVLVASGISHRLAGSQASATPARTPGGTHVPRPSSTMTSMAVRASRHLHWNRLARAGASALGAFVILVAGYLTLGAVGIGPGASLLAKGQIESDARLLVADFRVLSGPDTLLGDIVSEALRTDLSQSTVVNVVSPSVISQALQRMQRPPRTRVDSAIALEMAEREGISAIVDGTITPLSAGTYIITARLRAGDDGSELASFRETADGREIIEATERIARQLREEIGESLKDVRATPALAQVTTGSVEALRKYAAGVRAADIEADFPKAIELLREAVALDTTFAMAWRKLAVALNNYRMPRDEIDSAASRAFRYRDRLTEYERANTVGYYYQSGPGRSREKAIEAYESIADLSADEPAVHNLALLLSSRREYARAETLYRRKIAAGGAPLFSYGNLEGVLFQQGRIDEADSVRRVIEQLFPNAPSSLSRDFPYLYHRGQLDSVERSIEPLLSHSDPRARSAGKYALASLQLLRGQVDAGVRSFHEASQIERSRGAQVPESQDSMLAAFADLLILQNRERAIRRFDRIVAQLPDSQRNTSQISYFYAMAGMPDRSRRYFELDSAQQRDTIEQRLAEPLLHRQRAELLFAEGRPLEAISEFYASDSTVDGPANACEICIMPALGRSFDKAGMADSAIYWFERYLETPMQERLSFDLDVTILPQISRRLGELYEAKGDRSRAAAYYQKFVDLWKDADPELQPQVDDVRRRLARLVDPEQSR